MVLCLKRARRNRVGDLGPGHLIFPSYGAGYTGMGKDRRPACLRSQPYGSQAVLEQTRKFGEKGAITTHGFRTTINSWGRAIPHRGLPPFTLELMDQVLGHTVRAKDGEVSAAAASYVEGVQADLPTAVAAAGSHVGVERLPPRPPAGP